TTTRLWRPRHERGVANERSTSTAGATADSPLPALAVAVDATKPGNDRRERSPCCVGPPRIAPNRPPFRPFVACATTTPRAPVPSDYAPQFAAARLRIGGRRRVDVRVAGTAVPLGPGKRHAI